ncbi:thiol-disulfide oxidoreductase DCC family protein [Litorisediminicola beolgyonensis]|uniref:Thiol-disulfide oxidoreductase DCC family protein n=1 Tax=Litorisediminicola beolgyonensis TaxID=1173614 RepID=A0ABW3ZH09_9RHOB
MIYNDTCPICAREVAQYKRLTARHDLDIAYEGLSEGDLERYGLSERDAARRLHVMKDGQRLDGVDAFAAIWERMPGFRWLARVVRLPLIAPLARLLYDHVAAPALFALHRRRERLGKLTRRG